MLKTPSHRAPARGVALIVVLIILVIVTVVGIAGARIALLGERSTRFDRDYQIAWESAEAALIDAEFDIQGPNPSSGSRVAQFGTNNQNSQLQLFVDGCGTTTANRGLCSSSAASDLPVWQKIDFVNESATRPFVTYGDNTGRPFQAGGGVQPVHKPHYIIEWALDTRFGGSAKYGSPQPIIYRITSIGFGPNEQTQVMMQSVYAKDPN